MIAEISSNIVACLASFHRQAKSRQSLGGSVEVRKPQLGQIVVAGPFDMINRDVNKIDLFMFPTWLH